MISDQCRDDLMRLKSLSGLTNIHLARIFMCSVQAVHSWAYGQGSMSESKKAILADLLETAEHVNRYCDGSMHGSPWFSELSNGITIYDTKRRQHVVAA